jgi:2-oxoglutarate ferredoxin oxidoreductase subunit beta
MKKRGFAFVEVLAPCPVGFGRPNDIGDAMEEMTLYRERCVVEHGASLAALDIDLRDKTRPITLGNFVDIERPVFDPLAMMRPTAEGSNSNAGLVGKGQEG